MCLSDWKPQLCSEHRLWAQPAADQTYGYGGNNPSNDLTSKHFCGDNSSKHPALTPSSWISRVSAVTWLLEAALQQSARSAAKVCSDHRSSFIFKANLFSIYTQIGLQSIRFCIWSTVCRADRLWWSWVCVSGLKVTHLFVVWLIAEADILEKSRQERKCNPRRQFFH